jgi:hypothetical protein
VMTTTYLLNVITTRFNLKSPFELLYSVKPILHDNLKVFGEAGVNTMKVKIQAKLTNCRTLCIFVGYAKNSRFLVLLVPIYIP